MPEIVTDGTTPQMPLPAAEETYGRQTNPGIGRFTLSTLQDAGTAFLGRAAERGTVAGSSSFDQGMAALTATGGAFDQPLISVPQPASSPEMPPEQYNDLYAPRDTNGKVVSIGDKPMPEALAKIIGRQKAEAMQRESVLARYGETHSGITTFAVGSLASMLDPLNAGVAFLPAIGEGAVAARLGGGLLARTAARVAAGAEMGIAQQLPLSAIKFGLSPEEASDYGLRDAMRDLAYGAAGVAVLHTGIGSIGEMLARRSGAAAAPAGERLAVSAPGAAVTVEPPARAGSLTPAVRVDGKLYTGVTHADAYDAALREHGGIDPGSSASDRNLFVTAEGQPLSFEEARAYRAGTAILSADAVTKNAAMRGALGEISDGRPVDVAPIIDAGTPQTFTTAKGSVYTVHEDGTTTRNKSFHPEHGAADQGLQPRSEATFYVSPADAIKLAEIQSQGGPARVLAPLGDGRWGVKYVNGKGAGKFEARTVVTPASDRPAANLTPVEVFKGGARVHFGNEITEVGARGGNGPTAAPALARIDELTADRLAADRGERAAGSPAQSFSAIAAAEPIAAAAVEHSPADFLKLDPTISAADYTRRLGELRDNKPRPINKLWKNPDAAPPEDVAAAKERLKVWNSEYNKVSRIAKQALERDNEAFRAQQEARATPTAAASQAELAREGWAPSVARDELVAANDAVYGVKPEAESAPRPEAGSDAELTAAEERAAQIPPESLHPEDQAALAASAQGVEKAGFMQKAFETAASCIMGIV